MNESFKEQRPLLSEDPEEDYFVDLSPRYRASIARGRNSVKGAAAIINRWPEHWSSVFTYWWVCLSVMALIIFIFYNTIFAISMLPSVHSKPTKLPSSESVSNLSKVYVHFLVNSDDEVDLSKYLPYIEIEADKYIDYNFNLIILWNDTTRAPVARSAEENNEVALNSILYKGNSFAKKVDSRKNIRIQELTLSRYLDESPLRHVWRTLPEHFVIFLVRTVSIWEKGGISVNPDIFTPRSPNAIYIEKLHNILKQYKKRKGNMLIEPKIYNNHNIKYKKKVNNIRDIIEKMEHENYSNYSQENLIEAENVIDPIGSHNRRKLRSTQLQSHLKQQKSLPDNTEYDINDNMIIMDIKEHDTTEKSLRDNTFEVIRELHDISDDTDKNRLIPSFFNFLFYEKPSMMIPRKHEDPHFRRRRHTIDNDINENKIIKMLSKNNNKPKVQNVEKLKPIILSLDETDEKSYNVLKDTEIIPNNNNSKSQVNNQEEITLDVKGNIIATNAPCHAFIGTMFNNAINYSSEQTIQDFLISELSIFCKGLLSSCRGINLILL